MHDRLETPKGSRKGQNSIRINDRWHICLEWPSDELEDTALRLGQYFGMSADFWMNLPSAYALDLGRRQSGNAIQRIPGRLETPVEPRRA